VLAPCVVKRIVALQTERVAALDVVIRTATQSVAAGLPGSIVAPLVDNVAILTDVVAELLLCVVVGLPVVPREEDVVETAAALKTCRCVAGTVTVAPLEQFAVTERVVLLDPCVAVHNVARLRVVRRSLQR
jgi:hypothetical protein